MKAIEIINEHLKANGYDGLCTEGCGCEVGDLAPCGLNLSDCESAFKHTDPSNPTFWVMTPKNQPPTAEQWEEFRRECQ